MRLGWLLALMVGLLGNEGIAQVIQVRVIDEARQPVADAAVFFAPADPRGVLLSPPQTQRTGKDGTATLLLSGLWEASGWKVATIAIWAQKGEAESQRESVARPFLLTPPTLTLQLRPTVTSPLQFRLLNEKGNPVAKAWVGIAALRVSGEMAGWLMTVFSDGQGFVRGALRLRSTKKEERRFLLLVWHPKEGWAWRPCPLADLQGDLLLPFTPAQPVTMRFKNCFGEPVEGIKGRLVHLALPHFPHPIPLPPDPFTFASDKDGFLAVPLPKDIAGAWEWHAETPPDIARRYRHQNGLLSLSPGTHWSISFHENETQVAGKLVDAATQQPLAGCPLLLEMHPPVLFSAAGNYWHRTVTDQKGRFRIKMGLPLEGRPFFSAFFALHLPDGQRYWLKPPKEAEPFSGCWRVSLPPLLVKAPTSKIVAQGEAVLEEISLPKEVSEETRKRLALEWQEMRKRVLIFFVAIAIPQDKADEKTVLATAVNCEGKERRLQLLCRHDAIGAVAVAPPRQAVAMPLSDGDWLIAAFATFPPYFTYQIPRGVHFFALLSPQMPLVEGKNAQKIHLEAGRVKVVTLYANTKYGNLRIFQPDALKPK
ncbi:MAG: hypothetical protein THHGLFOP_000210 [Candidatus Fervidibacter sp.]|jgi:hypothetical protein